MVSRGIFPPFCSLVSVDRSSFLRLRSIRLPRVSALCDTMYLGTSRVPA